MKVGSITYPTHLIGADIERMITMANELELDLGPEEIKQVAVPFEYSHNVCSCPVAVYGEKTWLGPYDPAPCKKCGKKPRWVLIQSKLGCATCGKPWVYTFKHHGKNLGPYNFNCYACLVEQYGEQPDDYCPEWAKPRVPRDLDEIMQDLDDDEDLNFSL